MMLRPGPRPAEIVLSEDERLALRRMLATGSRRSAQRAAVVLACAEGLRNADVARLFTVDASTVGRWRSRFAQHRLAGLDDHPRTGRPRSRLVLTEAEQTALVGLVRRAKTPQALGTRARIVLACAQGRSNKEVAAHLQVSVTAVHRWRSRFVALRLEGLLDRPRPGRPPTALGTTDDQLDDGTSDLGPAAGRREPAGATR